MLCGVVTIYMFVSDFLGCSWLVFQLNDFLPAVASRECHKKLMGRSPSRRGIPRIPSQILDYKPELSNYSFAHQSPVLPLTF